MVNRGLGPFKRVVKGSTGVIVLEVVGAFIFMLCFSCGWVVLYTVFIVFPPQTLMCSIRCRWLNCVGYVHDWLKCVLCCHLLLVVV